MRFFFSKVSFKGKRFFVVLLLFCCCGCSGCYFSHNNHCPCCSCSNGHKSSSITLIYFLSVELDKYRISLNFKNAFQIDGPMDRRTNKPMDKLSRVRERKTRPIVISRVLREQRRTDGRTEGPTDRPTKRLIESRARD